MSVLLTFCLFSQTNGTDLWKSRLDSQLNSFFDFFVKNDTMYETSCEARDPSCLTDVLSFKGYAHRWLAVVTQVAPYTHDWILPILAKSARKAVNQCTGAPTGRRCGFYWSSGKFVDPKVDNTTGAGEAMNVLAAVSSLLIDEAAAPVTNETGTSKGDYGAGIPQPVVVIPPRPMTNADKAGASLLTFIYVALPATMFVWICMD